MYTFTNFCYNTKMWIKIQEESKMRSNRNKIYGILCVSCVAAILGTGCGSKAAQENQDAYRQIGINNLEAGKYEDAVDAFQKALDESLAVIGKEEIDICYYKAKAQYLSGDVDGAIETYDALISYDKKNSDAYYLRGSIYLTEGQEEDALSDYAAAVKQDDENYDLYIQVYTDLAAAGHTDEAEGYLKEATAVTGKNVKDYAMRGKAYVLLGDYDNATEQLDKAIEAGSEDAILYRAQVYEKQGDDDQAKSMYEEYVKNNSDNSAALGSLGSMLLEEGNYEDALNYIQMALALDDVENEQELRKNEILAYEYKKDFASAKEKMSSYVTDYPDDAEAVREYQFLQTRQ